MISRLCLFGCLLGFAIGLLTVSIPERSGGLSAQPNPKKPRDEEEEPEKSKVPKKIEEIEPKGAKATSPTRSPPVAGTFSIAAAAAKEKDPFVKEFLKRLSNPFDNLVPASGRTYRIGLMSERNLPAGKFTVVVLNYNLSGGKDKEFSAGASFSLQPYEEIVIEEVDLLLAKKLEGVRRDDLQELSVQVLQAARRFLASSIEQKKRVGKEWDSVDEKLRRRIVQIRRDQLKAYVAAKDWKKADELSLELSNYSDDPGAQKDIYRLLLNKELEALNPDRDEDFIKLRDAVNQFENIGGGQGEPLALTGRRRLTDRAQQYVDRAKKLAEANQNAGAFNLLKNAEALDPDLKDIQRLRANLSNRILYVGVTRLPERMSPALARSDPERWAMEMLFESLLQSVPDAELGRRFRPVLAASMPTMSPLGREFTIRKNSRWAGDGGKVLDARDVFGTLEMLRKIPHYPCAEGLDVLDVAKARIDDPYRLRVGFKQGLLEPLNRATFKILPARHLKTLGVEADNDLFARKPFGSGPYRYDGREQENAEREVAVFRANPYYTQRADKFSLPNIREIRFVVPVLSKAPADFANGLLHLILDVPTGDIPRYRDDPLSTGKVKVYTPTLNRRISMLAINHRRGVLHDDALRRGISAAIDRETILNEVFRNTEKDPNHRALVGPFPPMCWATPKEALEPTASLFNKTLAAGLLGAAGGKGSVRLTLKYPDDDPRAGRACGKIKEQIENASKRTPADAPSVEIETVPVAADVFLKQIEQEQDYELAYVPYDYKDDLYWLGSLLDRDAAGRGGRNFLGYLGEGSEPTADDNNLRIALDEIRSHRNFRDNVRAETWKLHSLFLQRMPFVPLWQIDRHMIVSQQLEMYLDNPGEKLPPDRVNPAAPLTGVEMWRLK